MDEIDTKQQVELDRLHEAAKNNRFTDRTQWLVMAIMALGILIYLNVIFMNVINIQAGVINRVVERCK